MTAPFDPDRCTMPPLDRIGPAPLLGDVTVPEPPEAIVDCLATLTPFVEDLGCIPVTVQGGSEATFPVRTASSSTGGLTLRIVPGPGCAYDFDFDLALPCLDLAGSGPRPVEPAAYSSDSVGVVAVTITPGPDCAYVLGGQAVLPSPTVLAIAEPAGLTARTEDGLGWGFVTLYRLDRWTGQLVPVQIHVKVYNPALDPVPGGSIVPTVLTDGALVAIDPPAGLCTVTLTGRIIGGDTAQLPLAGALVRAIGHVSGTDYGVLTATDGTYSFTIDLEAADVTDNLGFVDLIVTGPGHRFREGAPVQHAFLACGATTLPHTQATPAVGYHYDKVVSFRAGGGDSCQYPLRDTLTFVHPRFGTHTVAWAGGNWTRVCGLFTTRATGLCPSVTVPVLISIESLFVHDAATLGSSWFSYLWLESDSVGIPPSTRCPTDRSISAGTVTCANFEAQLTSSVGGTFAGYGYTLVERTCPDDVTPYSALWSYTVAADVTYAPWIAPGTTETVLVYEN